jgi:hypothetical protein
MSESVVLQPDTRRNCNDLIEQSDKIMVPMHQADNIMHQASILIFDRTRPVSSASRAYGYLFAGLTGASIGFNRSNYDLGLYEQVVAYCGVFFFGAMLFFVMASTNEFDRRNARLIRCAVIVVIAIAITSTWNLTRPFPGFEKLAELTGFSTIVRFTRTDAFALFYAVFGIAVSWAGYFASKHSKRREINIEEGAGVASAVLFALSALIAMAIH